MFQDVLVINLQDVAVTNSHELVGSVDIDVG